MKEDYLHYLWKFSAFNQTNLKTTDGESIHVIHPGFHNHDAGPDFFDGRIMMATTKWAGNIEIHIRASDWNRHLHSGDAAYDNVILHVVYDADEIILDRYGNKIPTLELKARIDSKSLDYYENFISGNQLFSCHKFIREMNRVVVFQQMDRALVNRLERKIQPLLQTLKSFHGDWEQTAYLALCRNFGFKTNEIPFELLGRRTPFNLLKRTRHNIPALESILFGQSGLLPKKTGNEYINELKNQYDFVKSRNHLKPIHQSNWKFSRMRPAAFPTIRIAQFSVLLGEVESLFQQLLEVADSRSLIRKFRVCATPFWDRHYTFTVVSPVKPKILGTEALNNILINTLVPLLFAYGDYLKEEQWKQKAIRLLEETETEKNQILQKWSKAGVVPANAAESQSLIELHNEWCSQKKCLNCSIGNTILKSL